MTSQVYRVNDTQPEGSGTTTFAGRGRLGYGVLFTPDTGENRGENLL